MRLFGSNRCKPDRDGMTAIYAAIAASILMWSGAAERPALGQVASASAADASSLAGDWAGALDVQGVQLRLVLHVATKDGTTTATLDSLDQDATGIPVSAIARTGDQMSFEIAAIAGSFKGDLSADGKTATGQWSQNGYDLPLTMKR